MYIYIFWKHVYMYAYCIYLYMIESMKHLHCGFANPTRLGSSQNRGNPGPLLEPMICPHMIPTLRANPLKLMVQSFFFMCSMAIKRRSRPTSNTPMYHIVGTIMYYSKCFAQCVAVRCCYLVVIWGPLGMRDGYQQALRNQSFWWLAVFLSIFMFMVSLGCLNCTR